MHPWCQIGQHFVGLQSIGEQSFACWNRWMELDQMIPMKVTEIHIKQCSLKRKEKKKKHHINLETQGAGEKVKGR